MKNKTISVLAAAALSIGLGFAATGAPARGEIQASVSADTVLLRQQNIGGKYIPQPKDGYVAGRKVGTKWLTPKTCYERKRVGPNQYVLVRRAC